MRLLILGFCLIFFTGTTNALPKETSQVILGIAQHWDSSHVTLSLLENGPQGWKRVKGPFPARLGKAGLVWGYGLSSPPKGESSKKEGDMRSPAGIFRLGGLYGTVPTPDKKKSLPYRRITTRDIWVSDPESKLYNKHSILNHEPKTAWEYKQQMRLNDYAHSLKLFIKHNAEGVPGYPKPGAGSSIFFHIWRKDGASPTAGCTAMSEKNLRTLIYWLDPKKHPLYILLPSAEYSKYRKPWGLP